MTNSTNSLPAHFQVSLPTRKIRRSSPPAAMEFWHPDTWCDWLNEGVQLHGSSTQSNKLLSFEPFLLDVNYSEPSDIIELLRPEISAEAFFSMEEGLVKAMLGWSGQDGARHARALLKIASKASRSLRVDTISQMFNKAQLPQNKIETSKLAVTLATLISKKLSSSEIEYLLPSVERILDTSVTASIIISCRLAQKDPTDLINLIEHYYPELFNLDQSHQHWRFLVNQLVEKAGLYNAIMSAYSDNRDNSILLRKALAYHRLNFSDAKYWEVSAKSYIFDSQTNKRFLVTDSLIEFVQNKSTDWHNSMILSNDNRHNKSDIHAGFTSLTIVPCDQDIFLNEIPNG